MYDAENLQVRGRLDSVDPDGRVSGWCWSPEEPVTRRPISILLDGQPTICATADLPRDDLLAAGIGDGGHGFLSDIPAELRGSGTVTVSLQDTATGRILSERVVIWARESVAPPKLTGNVDLVSRDGWVSGWCWDPDDPGRRLTLDVLIDEAVAGTTRAAEPRADLCQAAVGDGRYGFNVMLPYEMLAERPTVRIRVVEHGTLRPLGEASLPRIGQHAERETRLQELERQVTLLQARLDQATRDKQRPPDAEALARGRLFATATGIAEALAELRRSLPELSLRSARPGPDGWPLATIALAPGCVDQLHSCLTALREADVDLVADIVLLDPSAEDARGALLPALVANLRVGPTARTAVASFARLLREAETRLVGLLDHRTRPRLSWLGELAATLDNETGAAVVGSTVTRPDGLLHHAGLTLDADRRFRDLGFLAPAERREHRFLRPVDALAPLALLTDRDRVAAAGGLDSTYDGLGPAIADLCLRLRAKGLAVLRQPSAPVIWAGPDHQGDVLPESPATEDARRLGRVIARHADAALGAFVGHALVVDAEIPVPDRDAGSVAALEQMLVLRRLGWRVTFAAASDTSATTADRRRLERAGIEVADPQAGVTGLLREHGADLGLVHLHRHRVATLFLPRIRELAPRAKIIFSPADLHFLREAREAALGGEVGETPSETWARELACARAADATILHSDHEQHLLASELGPQRLHLLRWIARPVAAAPPFEAREGLLFIANFRHAPNVDAVLWYAREVLPILQRLRPGLILDVIGAQAPPAIRALDGPDIRVRGWVEALAPCLAAARLTIAPLRYGAGFKGKVATSLAAGVPVVGTPIAVEGTGLADGDGMAVADNADSFAGAIARLHDDATAWRVMSARARERVAALYSPVAAEEFFRALLAGLGLPAGNPSRR